MLFKENFCSSEDNLRNLWVCKVAGTQLSLGWKQQRITFIPTSHLQELLPGFLSSAPHGKAFQAIYLYIDGSFFTHLKWGMQSQALKLSVDLRHRNVLSKMKRGCSMLNISRLKCQHFPVGQPRHPFSHFFEQFPILLNALDETTRTE